MATKSLTARLRSALRSKEDKALIDGGFMYETGSLTKEGRKVVLNLLLEHDADLKSKLVEAAVTLMDSEKESSKKK